MAPAVVAIGLVSIQCRGEADNHAPGNAGSPPPRLVWRAPRRQRTRAKVPDRPRGTTALGSPSDSDMGGELRSGLRSLVRLETTLRVRPCGFEPAPAGTVIGMLPDFRFVIGALLAIAVLGIAGFGLAVSVKLVHQAQLSPLEESRSLAFAGRAEWNQFYEPERTRRIEGMMPAADEPVITTPSMPSVAAPSEDAPPEPERVASLPVSTTPASDRTEDKTSPDPVVEAAPTEPVAIVTPPAVSVPVVAAPVEVAAKETTVPDTPTPKAAAVEPPVTIAEPPVSGPERVATALTEEPVAPVTAIAQPPAGSGPAQVRSPTPAKRAIRVRAKARPRAKAAARPAAADSPDHPADLPGFRLLFAVEHALERQPVRYSARP